MMFKVLYTAEYVCQELFFDNIEKLARFVYPRQYFGDYFTIRHLDTGWGTTLYCDEKKMSIKEIEQFVRELTHTV